MYRSVDSVAAPKLLETSVDADGMPTAPGVGYRTLKPCQLAAAAR